MRKRVQKQASVEQDLVPPTHAVDENTRATKRRTVKRRADTEATDTFLQRDEENTEIGEAYFNGLVTHTSDAMVVLNQHFRVLDVNPAALTMLAGTRDAIVGHDCREILCCKNLNRMALCGTSSCPLTTVLQQQNPLSSAELLIGQEGARTYEASVSVTPVPWQNEIRAVFVARDLSALKIANQVRSNFVSMVSHELRTPLNSVHGFVDLLLQGHMGDLTEEQGLYLGYAQEGVQQLVSIVEDILFMTRSDLGQFEVRQQEVPILSLVRQTLRSLQPQALKAEVILVCDVPSDLMSLSIDPQRIKQVLNNLVTNAIKFTPPGGTVTISVRPHDERSAMILVADTGYGIPAEDRPYIFERFYQSNHSQQSRMGGYGLGLAIARLIVEQHGGMIDFDTQVNKGTTFYFTVPFYLSHTQTDPSLL